MSPSRGHRRCGPSMSSQALGPLLGAQVVFGDDVADADAAAHGLEPAGDLGQHRRLVGREVDHAVQDVPRRRTRPAAGSARSPPSGSAGSATASRAFHFRKPKHLIREVEPIDGTHSTRLASPTGPRGSHHPNQDKIPFRPRADRRPRSGCHGRARPAPPHPAARRAAEQVVEPALTEDGAGRLRCCPSRQEPLPRAPRACRR